MFHRFAHIKQYRLRPMIYSIKDIARLRWWQCNKKLPLDKFLAVVDCVSAKDIEIKNQPKKLSNKTIFSDQHSRRLNEWFASPNLSQKLHSGNIQINLPKEW